MEKRHNTFSIYFLLMLSSLFFFQCQHPVEQKEKQIVHFEEEEEEEVKNDPKFFEQLEKMLRDRTTGEVPQERLLVAKKIADRKRQNTSTYRNIPFSWEERGPNNVGGRTRAFIFDARDPARQTAFAGSVSGGIWKTTQLDSDTPNWTNINDFLGSISINSIVQDPSNLNTFYFATGEEAGSATSQVTSLGLWKSTDGGNTWNHLPSTSHPIFKNIFRMRIDDLGNLYVALVNNGIHQSTDGGNTWQKILGANNVSCFEIEIASNQTIYAQIPGEVLKSTNRGATWTSITANLFVPNLQGAVVLASQYANPDVVLLFICSQKQLFKSSNAGASWTAINLPDISNSQCWYDRTIGIHPTDENIFLVGTTSLFYTMDNGQNWRQGLIHADHHLSYFDPLRPGYVISTNDGGVYAGYIEEFQTTFFKLAVKNHNYNVTQFYTGAIHPDPNSNILLGGTQDNGTQVFQNAGINSTTKIYGGDGAYCAIDENEPNIWIASHQRGVYDIRNSTGIRDIIYTDGQFINPSIYDSQNNNLYSALNTPNTYHLVSDVGYTNKKETRVIPNAGTFSSFRMSPTVSNRLYIGTYFGKLFRVDNANTNITATPLINENTQPNPLGNTIRSISIEEGNEDHIITTYSNYGAIHIWETTNGGANWNDISGDFPDMPIWDGMFAPDNPDQFIIATDLGIWTTENLNGNNTVWQPSNNGLANTRVFQLQRRKADNMLLAASHGRGLFTSDYYVNNQAEGIDLELSLSTDVSTPPNYSYVNYTLTISNKGTQQATNVELEFPIPEGLAFDNKTLTQGVYSNFGAGTWDVGNLSANQSATLTLKLFTLSSNPITSYAQVTNATESDSDSSPDNNAGPIPNEDDEAAVTINGDNGGDCDLSNSNMTTTCLDQGTSQTEDDRFKIFLNPTGTDLGSNYNVSGDINMTGIPYGSAQQIGNDYLISNGALNITITDASGNCSFGPITINPPTPCSENNNGCTNTSNLALNKNTEQSTTLVANGITGAADKAVDGNTDGVFFTNNSSVSATQNENQSWWQVDLGASSTIEDILVYNRTDGTDKTHDFYVLVSDTPFGTTSLDAARTQANFEQFTSGLAATPTTITVNGTGRYVRVQMQGAGHLTIAEVEVIGCTDDPIDCTVSANISGISCDDNGTTNADDDLFYFDVNVTTTGDDSQGWEMCTSFNNGNCNNTTTGSFNNTTTIGPLQILDFPNGVFNTTINNLAVANCSKSISVNLPAPCSTGGGGGADLELSMTVDNNGYVIYENYIYTITLSNTGDESANNISVQIPKPAGMAYTSSNASQGEYLPWADYKWTVGNLDAGATATLELVWFTLVEDEIITAYAQVATSSPDDPDSTPGNGNEPTVSEDDEASTLLNPAAVAPRAGAYGEEKISVNGIRVYRVYPNPARELVTIQVLSSYEGLVQLEIFNIKAQRILSENFDLIRGVNQIKLETIHLPSGLYQVMLKSKKGKIRMTKFLIQE